MTLQEKQIFKYGLLKFRKKFGGNGLFLFREREIFKQQLFYKTVKYKERDDAFFLIEARLSVKNA